jgi:very-short-patch-repair endonuclease
MSESRLERRAAWLIQAAGLPEPDREYRFHLLRQFRFDFAWPAQRIGLEIEGGTWTGGRHTRGAGFAGDCEKYNEATVDGWRVLRVTGEMVEDGRMVGWLQRMMAVERPPW